MKHIQVTRSSMPDYGEYIEEIEDLWDSRWLTNNGAKHQQLESQLLEYLDTPNVTLFTNGHLGLEMAIAAFGLSGGYNNPLYLCVHYTRHCQKWSKASVL